MTHGNDGGCEFAGEMEGIDSVAQENKKPRYPLPLTIDFERYAELLDGADPDDPQVRKLIETLFQILGQIVDISFGLSPTQNVCGKLPEEAAEHSNRPAAMVKLGHSKMTQKFADAGGKEDCL